MENTFKNRKLKRILNHHLSQEEGQKVRVHFELADGPEEYEYRPFEAFYKAVYFKNEKNAAGKTRVRVEVYQNDIKDILSEYLPNYEITYMAPKFNGFGSTIGLTLSLQHKEAPQRQLKSN